MRKETLLNKAKVGLTALAIGSAAGGWGVGIYAGDKVSSIEDDSAAKASLMIEKPPAPSADLMVFADEIGALNRKQTAIIQEANSTSFSNTPDSTALSRAKESSKNQKIAAIQDQIRSIQEEPAYQAAIAPQREYAQRINSTEGAQLRSAKKTELEREAGIKTYRNVWTYGVITMFSGVLLGASRIGFALRKNRSEGPTGKSTDQYKIPKF